MHRTKAFPYEGSEASPLRVNDMPGACQSRGVTERAARQVARRVIAVTDEVENEYF